MAECVFCRIIEGTQPASVVYEDDLCVAFLNIRPINAGHTLVVPRCHVADIAELDAASGAEVFAVARKIALALRRGALESIGGRCDGVNLLLSDGTAAGQVVHHLHLHVIPRYLGDGAGFRRGTAGGPAPGRHELDAIADALARGLANARGA